MAKKSGQIIPLVRLPDGFPVAASDYISSRALLARDRGFAEMKLPASKVMETLQELYDLRVEVHLLYEFLDQAGVDSEKLRENISEKIAAMVGSFKRGAA